MKRLAEAVGVPRVAGSAALLHSVLALALPAPAHVTDEAQRAKFPAPKGLDKDGCGENFSKSPFHWVPGHFLQ